MGERRGGDIGTARRREGGHLWFQKSRRGSWEVEWEWGWGQCAMNGHETSGGARSATFHPSPPSHSTCVRHGAGVLTSFCGHVCMITCGSASVSMCVCVCVLEAVDAHGVGKERRVGSGRWVARCGKKEAHGFGVNVRLRLDKQLHRVGLAIRRCRDQRCLCGVGRRWGHGCDGRLCST